MQFPKHLYLVNLLLRIKIVIGESLNAIRDELINSSTGYKRGSVHFLNKPKRSLIWLIFVWQTTSKNALSGPVRRNCR